MKTYSCTEARKDFSKLLAIALKQEVIIREKNGQKYKIVPISNKENKSPFEISGIKTNISVSEILSTLKESRAKTVL
jgi:hypothetical protein